MKDASDDRQLAVSIPTYNRFDMVVRSVEQIIDDPRVGEICICDDASTGGSYEKLEEWAVLLPKVRLFRNEKNLDCYANKAQVLRHTLREWSILFDSDNILTVDYLDHLFHFPEWKPESTYLPTFAKPHFDYREFSGMTIKADNVAAMMDNETFRTALNTANCFVHKETYLKVWQETVDPVTADSMFMNYRLLLLGYSLVFVRGLEYDHTVHDGSHYKQNVHRTKGFDRSVVAWLRQLR